MNSIKEQQEYSNYGKSGTKRKIDPLVRATYALTFTTAILTIATFLLWWDAYKQSENNKIIAESAKISAEASLQSANAAIKADSLTDAIAKFNERVTQMEIRAYLTTESINFAKRKDSIMLSVRIKNEGKTPAYNVRAVTNWMYSDSEKWIDTLEQSITKIMKTTSFSVLTIGANQGITQYADAIPIKKAESLPSTYRLFFFGSIVYEDSFFRQHFLHFCMVYYPSVNAFTPCKKYNDTDR